jgi:hypothetical protein
MGDIYSNIPELMFTAHFQAKARMKKIKRSDDKKIVPGFFQRSLLENLLRH